MKAEFRSTSPQDAPAVAAFLQRIFGIAPNLPLIAPTLALEVLGGTVDWPGSRSDE